MSRPEAGVTVLDTDTELWLFWVRGVIPSGNLTPGWIMNMTGH